VYNEEIVNRIKDKLIEKGETIAVAESVTSGHLQAALSQGVEASKFFQGGITTYNVGQKTRQLNVEPILALETNSVTEKVAETMAVEVSKKFLSDYGVGITGYATMVPECEEEGIYGFFSIAYKEQVLITKKISSNKEGTLPVQLDYTHQVLSYLVQQMEAAATYKKQPD
jgi:nicotinamide-nucleotide amidase